MSTKLRTPLSRAKGLGAAHAGTEHWWRQRISSVALIPLTLWLAVAAARWPEADYGAVVAWLRAPWNTVMLLFAILFGSLHAALGIQVVVEDYVHADWAKILLIVATRLILAFAGLAAVFATLRIAFAG